MKVAQILVDSLLLQKPKHMVLSTHIPQDLAMKDPTFTFSRPHTRDSSLWKMGSVPVHYKMSIRIFESVYCLNDWLKRLFNRQ